MALISSIIKKYEAQAKERMSEARVNKTSNRESLFLNTSAPEEGGGTGGAHNIATTAGSTSVAIWDVQPQSPIEQPPQLGDWDVKMSAFHDSVKNAACALRELNMNGSMLAELERLKMENATLREKLKKYE